MFLVIMQFCDDLMVEADEYEVDEDGDMVFWSVVDEDDDEMVEVGRVKDGCWAAVFTAEEDEAEGDLCE